MTSFVDKLVSLGLKSILAAYLLVALLTGVEKHRENGTRDLGAVITTIEGAAWPIPWLAAALEKQ